MIGYLQCQGCFNARLKIGPEEEQLQTATNTQVEGLPLVGHFAFVENERILFYRWEGDLRLRLDGLPTMKIEGMQMDWELISERVDVKLRRGNEVLVVRNYPASRELMTLNENPTPFIESEDCDFFLFIHNVLVDMARANRIYRIEYRDSP